MEYSYKTQNGLATNRISEVIYKKHGNSTWLLPKLVYTYDQVGNILSVQEKNTAGAVANAVTYSYDTQNQLLQETLSSGENRYYSYDTFGNIRSKSINYGGIYSETYDYEYGNPIWQDQLTKIVHKDRNGVTTTKTLSYDAIGNPTNYYSAGKDWTLSWQYGTQLAKLTSTDESISITNTYDVDGIRDSKTIKTGTTSVVHDYTTLSGKIIRERFGATTVDYLYDNLGRPYKLIINDQGNTTVGYYVLNQQGDVIAILNSSGTVAVEYEYDAWGRVVEETANGSIGNFLKECNALKYRGYYYDSDMGLYYLNSRFYNPEICRFISADTIELVLASQSTLSDKNLYAYCDNNPVMRRDESGAVWETVFDVVSLGASITEVVANPKDPWAWAGVIGDAVDMIPVLTGVGEAVRGFKAVGKVDDIAEDVGDIAKIATTGTPNKIGKMGEALAGINPKAKISIKINNRIKFYFITKFSF